MMGAGWRMALLNVNAAQGAAGHVPAGDRTLTAALGRLAPGQSVTVMIHGYRFCPFTPEHDPHRHILSLTPRTDCWKAVSWPRHLYLDRPGAALGIGFGWPATGPLPRVARRAHEAGRQLARMIRAIHAARPDVPVHIVAHSLGARVALTALETAPAGVVARMILISGAEYRAAAERALSSPAAARCQVLNVTSGENAAFDLMFRLAVAPSDPFDRPLSAGLGHRADCIDLAIDDGATRDALRALGHRLRPPATRICHWSGYMRPGLFAVYRRMLDMGDTGFAHDLTQALAPPSAPAPGERWRAFPGLKSGLTIAAWAGRSQV
jgi:pimeloyl-ACP methyl ester carboxylesterase